MAQLVYSSKWIYPGSHAELRSPHVPEYVDTFPEQHVQVCINIVPAARISHSHVIDSLEVCSLSEVLCQQGEPLGTRGEVVLQGREVVLFSVLHSLCMLLICKPSSLTVDGNLIPRETPDIWFTHNPLHLVNTITPNTVEPQELREPGCS